MFVGIHSHYLHLPLGTEVCSFLPEDYCEVQNVKTQKFKILYWGKIYKIVFSKTDI